MIEKVIDITKNYIEQYRANRVRNYQFSTECILEAMVVPSYLKLEHLGTYFKIVIYRDSDLIQVNDIEYRQKFNFIEMFIALEQMDNISFNYAPSTEEKILEEKMIYNRDKTIKQLLYE
jgi:hypothetical protein